MAVGVDGGLPDAVATVDRELRAGLAVGLRVAAAVARGVAAGPGVATGVGRGVGAGDTVMVPPVVVAVGVATKVTVQVPVVVTREDPVHIFPAWLRATVLVPPPARVRRAVTLLGGLPAAASTRKVKVVAVVPLLGVTDPFWSPDALITGEANIARQEAASSTTRRPRKTRGGWARFVGAGAAKGKTSSDRAWSLGARCLAPQ